MSKNILELLKDKIRDYEKTEKSAKVKLPESFLNDIRNYTFKEIYIFLITIGFYHRVDSTTSYTGLSFPDKDKLEPFIWGDTLEKLYEDSIDVLMEDFPKDEKKEVYISKISQKIILKGFMKNFINYLIVMNTQSVKNVLKTQ